MNEDTIELPAPADSLAAVEALLKNDKLRGHWVHPRHVFVLAGAIPAEERDRVAQALYAGTKLAAADPRRELEDPAAVAANGPAAGKPNVLIEARHLAQLVEAARPFVTGG